MFSFLHWLVLHLLMPANDLMLSCSWLMILALPISVATGRKSKHPISTHWQRRDCGFRNTAKCHSPRVLRCRLVLGAAGNLDLGRINRDQHALAQGVTSPGMFVISFSDSP